MSNEVSTVLPAGISGSARCADCGEPLTVESQGIEHGLCNGCCRLQSAAKSAAALSAAEKFTARLYTAALGSDEGGHARDAWNALESNLAALRAMAKREHQARQSRRRFHGWAP